MSDLILKTRVIALTGGIATGKSTVAHFLKSQGWIVIDADRLSRQVLAPHSQGLAQVVDHFGTAILSPSGALDRAKLGKIVFNDPEQRKRLEVITHPLIRHALVKECHQLKDPQSATLFYEAALIYETKTHGDFKEVWVTACTPEAQILRLMARNQWSEDQARTVIHSQMALTDKIKQADHVIWTDQKPEFYLPDLLQYLKDRRL